MKSSLIDLAANVTTTIGRVRSYVFPALVALGIVVSVGSSAAEEIVLKAVTFLPPEREKMQIKGGALVDRINTLAAEKAPGKLKIEIIGGPEVIPSADQPIAVRSGSVDMALTCASFYQGLVPVADIILLSEVTLEEERSRGALEYIRELHEKVGLFALGRMDGTREPFFYVGTTRAVTKSEDLNGSRAGSVSLFAEAMSRALGMSLQVIPFGDTHSAVENNVVDVYVNALDTQAAIGLHTIAGYKFIDHPVYVDNCIAIVNLDKWQSLPKELQDIMLEGQQQHAVEAGKKMAEFNAAQRQKLIDAGVEFVKFSETDAAKFRETAYDAQWQKMLESQPEVASKLRAMLTK